MKAAVPNRPINLSAVPATDGSFVVSWNYNPLGQLAAPSTFRVYSDSGTGTINYAVPLGSVSYVSGLNAYTYTTAVLAGAGDTKVQFVVRAESAAAHREMNTAILPATGRTTAPYGTLKTGGGYFGETAPGYSVSK
jgi:hypothetical protein